MTLDAQKMCQEFIENNVSGAPLFCSIKTEIDAYYHIFESKKGEPKESRKNFVSIIKFIKVFII